MKVREFLNTCNMPWYKVFIEYYSVPGAELDYMESYCDIRDIPEFCLNRTIDAWDVICELDESDGTEKVTIVIEL